MPLPRFQVRPSPWTTSHELQLVGLTPRMETSMTVSTLSAPEALSFKADAWGSLPKHPPSLS